MKLKPLMFLILAFSLLLASCDVASSGSVPALDGTHWKLVQLNGQGVVADSQASLAFEKDQVSGNGSCNSFGGEYTRKGNELTFGPLMSTLMACMDNGIMEQETAYMQALGQVTSYEVRDGNLLLFNDQGQPVAEFMAE